MAAYRRVDDLTVTCRLTACTPGSAPGPTLCIEYGKPLPFIVCVHTFYCNISRSYWWQNANKSRLKSTVTANFTYVKRGSSTAYLVLWVWQSESWKRFRMVSTTTFQNWRQRPNGKVSYHDDVSSQHFHIVCVCSMRRWEVTCRERSTEPRQLSTPPAR